MERAHERLAAISSHLLCSGSPSSSPLVFSSPVSCPAMSSCPAAASCPVMAGCPAYASSSPLSSASESSKLRTSPVRSPLRVLVTGAAGQIAYSLAPLIARGLMFGPHQPVILHLLDIPAAEQSLKGLVMELQDCAFSLLRGVLASTEASVAFKDVDVAILVGAFPRQPGMQRKGLLQKNAAIFKEQGRLLNEVASKNVKVLVVGNPANTNCLIAQRCAPSIPASNFSALTRLDHNRAKSLLAEKLGVGVSQIHNVFIWGNHSTTQFPDISHGYVSDFPSPGMREPIRTAVNDDSWLTTEFISSVQERGAAILKARKLSSAASAASAVVGHMRDWWLGERKGEVVSMAVLSDGSYDVPRGLIYSFPVECLGGGEYRIIQGLKIDTFARGKMEATSKELLEEKEAAFSFLGLE